MTPRRPADDGDLAVLNPGEVVTHARANDVRLADGRTLVLITLDNDEARRPNTLGPRSLLELRTALSEAMRRGAAGEIAAVAVTGKPYMLAAGADLTAVRMPSEALARRFARLGHTVFGLLHEAPVPTFAFINGLALGGGLELALHADHRTVNLAAVGIGLPEVSLGLVPGWGGSLLVPNLVGIRAALRIIIENPLRQKTLRGTEALEAGLADAGFGPARFLEESIAWAGRVLAGEVQPHRDHVPGTLERTLAWDAAIRVARRRLARRIGTVPRAPFDALALLQAAKHGGRRAGFAREEKTLTRLIRSPQFQASRYAFGLVQHHARHPSGAPDVHLAQPVTKVGILGAGLMACQIATTVLYRTGLPVVITDTDRGRVDAGLGRIRTALEKLHAAGRIGDDRLGRLTGALHGSLDAAGFAGCDWIVEAVYEELAVKHAALRTIEPVVGEQAVLATNTSSLAVTEIGAGLARPERLVGFHFFNPVARMRLVEIVPGARTSEQALASAFAFAGMLRKNPIRTSDTAGFAVNRVLARFLTQVGGALDKGLSPEAVDEALRPIGLPMTPSLLLELVGLPVAAHVLEAHHAAFGARFPRSAALTRLAQYGHLYRRDAAGRPTRIDKKARALLGGRGRAGHPGDLLHATQVALADEIHRMLDEHVVHSVEDVDLGLILGAGWPFHTGGISPYLDRVGASAEAFGGAFHTPQPGV